MDNKTKNFANSYRSHSACMCASHLALHAKLFSIRIAHPMRSMLTSHIVEEMCALARAYGSRNTKSESVIRTSSLFVSFHSDVALLSRLLLQNRLAECAARKFKQSTLSGQLLMVHIMSSAFPSKLCTWHRHVHKRANKHTNKLPLISYLLVTFAVYCASLTRLRIRWIKRKELFFKP